MGLRFRKSIKLLPGVRMSVGSGGIGWSLGPRGASISVSKRGVYSNVGIPGTGLSFRQKIGGDRMSPSQLERAERRYERELARAEKEAAKLREVRKRAEELANCKLSLKDDGTLSLTARGNTPLSRKEIALMWEQQGERIFDWLSEQADKINSETRQIVDIHLDTPPPDIHPTYVRAVFDESPPNQPFLPERQLSPDQPAPRSIGFIARLLPWKRRAFEQAVRDDEAAYAKAVSDFELNEELAAANHAAAVEKWHADLAAYEVRKSEHSIEQDRLAEEWQKRLHGDVSLMEEVLSSAVDGISWPRETIVSFDVRDDGRFVVLDVDLPEIEDLPIRLADAEPSRKGLAIRRKSKKQLRAEYLRHVHGVGLHLLGSTFSAVPSAQTIVVSGYSQRIDRATGIEHDDYLFSVRATRDEFARIDFENLENVDPVVALGAFEIRRNITSGDDLKAIEPIELNRDGKV